MPKLLIAVAACVAALAAAEPESPAAETGKDKDEPPTLSVTGTGKISAAPDMADISMGVLSSGNTAREALSANNEAMASLLESLKQHGVAAKDVQTTQIQVTPQYSQPVPNRPADAGEFIPRVVGYRVVNMVHVTSRDLSKLGQVLDAVVQAGANQMHGISFRIHQPEKLLDEARKRAMADAKRKADLLAGEANMVVGPPRSITESGTTAPQPPQVMYARAMAAAPSVPVAGGEQELTVSVHVVYEMHPPK